VVDCACQPPPTVPPTNGHMHTPLPLSLELIPQKDTESNVRDLREENKNPPKPPHTSPFPRHYWNLANPILVRIAGSLAFITVKFCTHIQLGRNLQVLYLANLQFHGLRLSRLFTDFTLSEICVRRDSNFPARSLVVKIILSSVFVRSQMSK
jgi:hypothetical protein